MLWAVPPLLGHPPPQVLLPSQAWWLCQILSAGSGRQSGVRGKEGDPAGGLDTFRFGVSGLSSRRPASGSSRNLLKRRSPGDPLDHKVSLSQLGPGSCSCASSQGIPVGLQFKSRRPATPRCLSSPRVPCPTRSPLQGHCPPSKAQGWATFPMRPPSPCPNAPVRTTWHFPRDSTRRALQPRTPSFRGCLPPTSLAFGPLAALLFTPGRHFGHCHVASFSHSCQLQDHGFAYSIGPSWNCCFA